MASFGLTVFGGVSNTASPAYARMGSTVTDMIITVRRWPAAAVAAASGRLGTDTCGDGAGDTYIDHH